MICRRKKLFSLNKNIEKVFAHPVTTDFDLLSFIFGFITFRRKLSKRRRFVSFVWMCHYYNGGFEENTTIFLLIVKQNGFYTSRVDSAQLYLWYSWRNLSYRALYINTRNFVLMSWSCRLSWEFAEEAIRKVFMSY